MKKEEHIISRINWDETLHPKNEWIIMYEDRHLGLKEINFEEFENLDEFEKPPLHRIRGFKRNNTLMWHRPTKTDFINKQHNSNTNKQ